jgi:hypothetical protein
MKKSIFLCFSIAILLSGCYDAQSGAMTGGYAGLIFGSAIGGIIDGPRGHDIGTLVGGLGGAVAGAAIGDANNTATANNNYRSDGQEDTYRHYKRTNVRHGNDAEDTSPISQNDNYTPGDDRINMYNDEAYTGNYSAVAPHGFSLDTVGIKSTLGFSFKLNPAIELQNIRLVDANRNRAIDANEESKIIFEVMNRSNSILYDIQPLVIESTGNKHIFVSPGVHVESIEPGKGIRYTAIIKADKHLKDGSAQFRIAVMQGNHEISSAINEIEVQTLGRH